MSDDIPLDEFDYVVDKVLSGAEGDYARDERFRRREAEAAPFAAFRDVARRGEAWRVIDENEEWPGFIRGSDVARSGINRGIFPEDSEVGRLANGSVVMEHDVGGSSVEDFRQWIDENLSEKNEDERHVPWWPCHVGEWSESGEKLYHRMYKDEEYRRAHPSVGEKDRGYYLSRYYELLDRIGGREFNSENVAAGESRNCPTGRWRRQLFFFGVKGGVPSSRVQRDVDESVRRHQGNRRG